jgi:hypothetical protein
MELSKCRKETKIKLRKNPAFTLVLRLILLGFSEPTTRKTLIQPEQLEVEGIIAWNPVKIDHHTVLRSDDEIWVKGTERGEGGVRV